MGILHHRRLSPARRAMLAAIGLTAALASAPAIADTGPGSAGSGSTPDWQDRPLSDDELAVIRGKFIRSDAISYFGISMLTSWQDANGVTTIARLVFDVDFLGADGNGAPVPQLMIGWVREGDPAMDVTGSHSGYTPIVGALDTTQGAAQINAIAGADNVARNAMQVVLVPTSQLDDLAALDQTGLTAIGTTTGYGFGDGDQLQFRLAANEIGLVLTGNNGSDNAVQSVGGDFGRMLQQTLIASDGNRVFNSSAVIIGADMTSAAFDAVRATEAMSAMKGHGF